MTAVADRFAQSPARQFPWLSLAAPALILMTLMMHYLSSGGYDLLRPESLIVMAASGVAGLASGAVSRLRPVTLEPLFLATLLMGYLYKRPEISDQLWSAARMIMTATGEPASIYGFFGTLAVAAFMLCWLLRVHLAGIVSIAFVTMLVSTILLPQGTGAQPVRTGALPNAGKDLPPLIHVILDEHIGVAGLPLDVQGSSGAASVLRSTYREFVHYSHAYSRFGQTAYSLASLMSGTARPDLSGALSQPEDSHKYRVESNEWYRHLKDEGYAINVYQTSYLDFCKEADACYTYSGSISSIQQTPLTTMQRIKVILGSLIVPGWPNMHPLASMEALNLFMREIEQTPRGTAHILHLILPHFGYLFHDDCSVVEPGEWGSIRDRSLKEQNTPDERKARYGGYISQLVCVSETMTQLFAKLERLGVYDEATIIVHGDHGSRIGERRFNFVAADSLSDRDMMDHFSTLLAVKMPDISAGVNSRPVAIQDQFAKQFLGLRSPEELADTVFIREPDTKFNTRKIRWPAP